MSFGPAREIRESLVTTILWWAGAIWIAIAITLMLVECVPTSPKGHLAPDHAAVVQTDRSGDFPKLPHVDSGLIFFSREASTVNPAHLQEADPLPSTYDFLAARTPSQNGLGL
jgi:hypothetical protein